MNWGEGVRNNVIHSISLKKSTRMIQIKMVYGNLRYVST